MTPVGVASGSATTDELEGAGASLTIDNLNQVLPMIKTPI
jgi:hypothetical protein